MHPSAVPISRNQQGADPARGSCGVQSPQPEAANTWVRAASRTSCGRPESSIARAKTMPPTHVPRALGPAAVALADLGQVGFKGPRHPLEHLAVRGLDRFAGAGGVGGEPDHWAAGISVIEVLLRAPDRRPAHHPPDPEVVEGASRKRVPSSAGMIVTLGHYVSGGNCRSSQRRQSAST